MRDCDMNVDQPEDEDDLIERLQEQVENEAGRGTPYQSVLHWARRAAALHNVAAASDSESMLNDLECRSCDMADNVPRCAGTSNADVLHKVAVLVRYLQANRHRAAGELDLLPIHIAASVLADLVLIDGRDMKLPDSFAIHDMMRDLGITQGRTAGGAV